MLNPKNFDSSEGPLCVDTFEITAVVDIKERRAGKHTTAIYIKSNPTPFYISTSFEEVMKFLPLS